MKRRETPGGARATAGRSGGLVRPRTASSRPCTASTLRIQVPALPVTGARNRSGSHRTVGAGPAHTASMPAALAGETAHEAAPGGTPGACAKGARNPVNRLPQVWKG